MQRLIHSRQLILGKFAVFSHHQRPRAMPLPMSDRKRALNSAPVDESVFHDVKTVFTRHFKDNAAFMDWYNGLTCDQQMKYLHAPPNEAAHINNMCSGDEKGNKKEFKLSAQWGGGKSKITDLSKYLFGRDLNLDHPRADLNLDRLRAELALGPLDKFPIVVYKTRSSFPSVEY